MSYSHFYFSHNTNEQKKIKQATKHQKTVRLMTIITYTTHPNSLHLYVIHIHTNGKQSDAYNMKHRTTCVCSM